METKSIIETNLKSIEFGYYDREKDEFIEIDCTEAQRKQLAKRDDFRELIIEAISMLTDLIKSEVGQDLKDIWKRLDKIERRFP